MVLYALVCTGCHKKWGATLIATDRVCPFCGDVLVRVVGASASTQ